MFIFSNLATSVDGKIATSSLAHFPLGTTYDRKLMQTLRKKCDAVLMGASTLRSFRRPLLIRNSKRQPVNVIISSKLEGISPNWKFFTEPSTRKILFVSQRFPKLSAFEKRGCEIYFIKNKSNAAKQIAQTLRKLGIKRLLVEGGGGVMWDFVKGNFIDEYYVTLTPRILGGINSPTLVDGEGFVPKNVINLKLVKSKRIGNELYLTYRKTAHRGA
jgi:riboflavin-specific deaminase-like protein